MDMGTAPGGAGIIGSAGPSLDWGGFLRRYWFVVVAAALMAVPALQQLGKIVWSTEQGAHGPIILATGLWLLVRELPAAMPLARAGDARLAWPVIAVSYTHLTLPTKRIV